MFSPTQHGESMLKKKDEFEDILEERRNSSDLRYALRSYTPPLYKEVTPATANELKDMVLQSDPLCFVVRQVSTESGRPVDEVQAEASAILEEMAHGLQLSTVRFFAFTLSKVFKTLFRSIHVNEDGIQRLQQAVQENPVVLLPSHRSYLDFLLMSYILYTYDTPLPVIAAGMDFMGMKMVGEMLRKSGAFFIRRSFGGDKLYWAVFSEYVQTLLKKGYAPIEFFLEGTRSRTSKSLTPKLGLLNVVLEPFFKGEVYDVTLLPVSISYERILEESLYARELLGVPKPKESTSGLFKARKVLSEDYGSIHVYFGQPVSVRKLSEGRVKRSQFNLMPRHIPKRPGEDINKVVIELAYQLVQNQQANMVLNPFVLLATLLLQNHHQSLASGQKPGMKLQELTDRALWLRDLSRLFGACLQWPDDRPPAEVVSSSLRLHPGLVTISEGRVQLALPGEPHGASSPEEELFNQAVIILSCVSYRNQMLHVFVGPALVASAMNISSSTQKNEIANSHSFLRNMFFHEFILCPGGTNQDLSMSFDLLEKARALDVFSHHVLVPEEGHRTLSFLSSLLDPFLQGYQVMETHGRSCCESKGDTLTDKQFVPDVRKFIVKQILAGRLKYSEVLSSDLQKNALAALSRLGAVQKIKGSVLGNLKVNKVMVNWLEDTLGEKEAA
uniref:Glyceronephosphate O-acyltransferase n=1 Tax=Cynoglossus semilaevis TaxID=244447 RepID=A0A3P8UVZ2_CYNSE